MVNEISVSEGVNENKVTKLELMLVNYNEFERENVELINEDYGTERYCNRIVLNNMKVEN